MTTRAGAVFLAMVGRALCPGLLAALLLGSFAASAADFSKAILERERASGDVRHIANWVIHARDNHAGDESRLPFIILDKKAARLFVFDSAGRLRGAAPALLGMGIGDTAVPGLGARELSNISPRERITQAGRFVADLGLDSKGEDVLWLDYQDSLAIHRVITTNPKERRAHRLATSTPADNRISYGCINIPVKFYEEVVRPAFTGTRGVVYVLPETKPLHTVFASYDVNDYVKNATRQSPLQRVSAKAD